jgi:hypothetical protein
MTVHAAFADPDDSDPFPAGSIVLRARAEGGTGMIGDATRVVRPGGTAFGRPYQWWRGRGEGPVRIGPDGVATAGGDPA